MIIYLSAQLLRLLYNLEPIKFWVTAPVIQFLSLIEIIVELGVVIAMVLAVVLGRNKDKIKTMLDRLEN